MSGKNDLIVCGFLREILNEYVPDIIVYNVVLFYNIVIFNIFRESGGIANKIIKNIVKMYPNQRKHYYITMDNGLYLSNMGYEEKVSFGNEIKYPLFASTGLSNEHSFVYTIDNQLYGFDSNKFNQLGINTNYTVCKEPVFIDVNRIFKEKLTAIKCGIRHSIFLTLNGNIFGCGANDSKQLSFNDTDITYNITRIKLSTIQAIGVLSCSSFALDDNGKLYSFGFNTKGCLGINSGLEIAHGINRVKMDKRIIKIANGACHTGIITDTNELYLFGWNYFRQCPVKNSDNDVIIPTKFEFNSPIIDIVCGGHHNIIKTKTGEYYGFGWNHQQQCLVNSDSTGYIVSIVSQLQQISLEYLKNVIEIDREIIGFIGGLMSTYILQKI